VAFEIKQQWQLKKTAVIPLVLSAARVIPNILNQSQHTQFTTAPPVSRPESGLR